MKNLTLFVAFFGALSPLATGQSLTLPKAIATAQANSPIAKQINANFAAQNWRFREAKAFQMPQISLNGTIPGYYREIGNITQPDGSLLFQNYSRAFSNASLNVSQVIMATGGTVSVRTGLERIDVFGNSRNTFWASQPLMLSLSQPLFQINRLKWNWQQQQIRFAGATREQAENLEDLSVRVTQKFFDLYLAKLQLRNAEYNQAINDTIYTVSQGRFSLGKIAESDLLQVEYGLMNARNSVEVQNLRIAVSEKELNILLSGNADAGKIEVTPPQSIPAINPLPQRALEEAKNNRSDYQGFQLEENMARMNLKSAEISRRFQADMSVSLGFNQTAPRLGGAFQNLQGSQSAFINFTIPIANFGRAQANYEAVKATMNSTLERILNNKNTLEMEVFNQVIELKQLRTSLQLSAKADTIAQKRYTVSKNRYLIGKIEIRDLFIAQNEKDTALITYIQALQAYWVAYYRLRRLTLYDFEADKRIGAW